MQETACLVGDTVVDQPWPGRRNSMERITTYHFLRVVISMFGSDRRVVEADAVIAKGRLSRYERARRATTLWPWLPLPLAVAYLLVLATKFSQVVGATYLNADAASAPVIGQLYTGGAAHRQVILGSGGFSTLMFEIVTRWVPLHRELWEAASYAMALGSAGLISLVVWKLAGRWAAAIAAVLLVCAGPQTLMLQLWLADHSPTWFSIALLAGLLAVVQSRPTELRPWMTGVLIVTVGLVVGVNAASDLLLVVGGLVPLFLAASATWLARPSRTSATAWWLMLGVLVTAGVGDLLTRAIMHSANVRLMSGLVHTQLASQDAIARNFKLWWQSLMALGDGDFFGQLFGFTSGLQVVCAVLVLVALGVSLRYAWRDTKRLWRAAAGPLPGLEASRIAWCIYWASSAALVSAAFIFSTNPLDLNSMRYLVTVIYAVAALVPLIAGRRLLPRAVITAGTALFALTGLAALLKNEALAGSTPRYQSYNMVARIAAQNHLDFGYADYWDAAPLTWATHMHLKVYPTQDCVGPTGWTLCLSPGNEITSWYKPRPGRRSFLISQPGLSPPASPQASFGRPSRVYHIGAMTMYIYNYDLARIMQP